MRRYLIFFTAGLSLFMSAIDSTVVAVAFPNFTRELHSTVLWSSWTISIFFIAVTMTLPLAGNLADSFGRKKLFLVSLLLFTGSSLACGLAPNIYTLIAFRFLQGLGGACFVPAASGIVSDHFPDNREAVIGLITSIYSGPPLVRTWAAGSSANTRGATSSTSTCRSASFSWLRAQSCLGRGRTFHRLKWTWPVWAL